MIINKDIFKIMLRRKNLLLLDYFKIEVSRLPLSPEVLKLKDPKYKGLFLAATVGNNLEQLGYTLSENLFEKMINDIDLTKKVSSDFVINSLKELKGDDVKYVPMYPNFPAQVINADELSLYLNAIIHYISGGNLVPKTEKTPREKLNEKTKLTSLDLGTVEDVEKLLNNLLNSSVEWSKTDIDDIYVILNCMNIEDIISKLEGFIFENKENLAHFFRIMYLLSVSRNIQSKEVLSYLNGNITLPTDVLRIINVMHGSGDASLSTIERFNNIPRSMRDVYLSMINNLNFEISKKDMKRNVKLWIKVGEKLHPGEKRYAELYPNSFKLFNCMRDSKKLKQIQTTYAEIEEAINLLKNEGSLNGVKSIKSVGVIARNLDRLVRGNEDCFQVLEFWKETSKKVSPEVLWSVYAHFNRELKVRENKYRIFISKGENSKTVIREDKREAIPEGICKEICDITFKAIQEIYKNKPKMDRVYIDSAIYKCKCPNNNRSGNTLNVPMSKGSKIPMDNNSNFIRGFIWWTNIDGIRTDIDLSCNFYNENFMLLGDVTYYKLKTEYATHSGDITNGGPADGDGASEFLDIDIQKALNYGCRYAVFTVNSYTLQNFSDMENIKFGFMERELAEFGEIYEPSKVKQCIKLCSKSTSCVACAFDLVNREIIWIDDVAQRFISNSHINNVAQMTDGITASLYKAIHMEKPDLLDVVMANVLARDGRIVSDVLEADLAFVLNKPTKSSETKFITPFDLDYFMGDLMPKTSSLKFDTKEEKEFTPSEFQLFLLDFLETFFN